MNYLNDAQQANERLKLVRPNLITETAVLGSLVKTDSISFFIAISLGKVELENEDYYIISMLSPIGQLIKSKSKGHAFEFNAKKYVITEIL